MADACTSGELRAFERLVFGAVHGAHGATHSSLAVRVEEPRHQVEPAPWDEAHGANFGWTRSDEVHLNGNTYLAGVRYLGSQAFRATKTSGPRWLYPSHHRARLRLRWRPLPGWSTSPHNDTDGERAVWASLWLMVQLGGIGSRTRRGFGAIDFDEGLPERAHELLPGLPGDLGDSPAACAAAVHQGLSTASEAVAPFRTRASERRGELATLAHSRVVVIDHEFASGTEALTALGDAIFAYRHHRNPDTDATINGASGTPLERPTWGLPLQMPTRMLAPQGAMKRWPAPLSFTVARLRTGRCVLVALARDLDLVGTVAHGERYPTEVAGNSGSGAVSTLLDQFLADERHHAHVAKSVWSAEEAWP